MLTLKKVKELVEAPSHAKRTPSPKMLFEEGIVLLRREFDQGSHLTVYNSGYVLFSAGKRNTVFHIHDCCGDYAYDAAEGNHYMKALGVEKNPDPLPGSLDVLQCRNGIDTIVEDYKTVPGWDNPYIQNHVVQPLQGALAVQDVELAYELPDAYFHIQTCDDGFDYTLYNKDFTEQDGGILETDGDKSVQEAMTELLTEFGYNATEGRIMDAAGLREQADTVAEQQAEVLKEKLAAERPAPEETLSFYVAECLEFTFAGEFHDHLTMEEALEAYDKIPSERMNADKCIGFCIEEDGGFVGMYELVVNDKVQRENINSINYFRDDKLVQQAISDMEKLMSARQQSKEQERGSTKKSVLDALRSLKAKKQEQPAQEQDKPKKAKKKGMEL